MDPWNALLEFYVSLVTYTVMHMIFVIAGDFVEAFNIPPLNIGIYADKLAAIRALLMVIADILEYLITQKHGLNDYSMDKALTSVDWPQGARRIGSLLSFIAMLACRVTYLWIVYKSDNKSLSVFIVLCIEGFWFGTFQMGFFAIGPEYNAFTSLGIHTMGNFIFFLQLILQHRAKTKPYINCLYRVRVHGWVCVATSVIALGLWLHFCINVTAPGEDSPSQWPESHDVWSPLLLFIVGAFAEDFSVPGILPFAFLDPEKANLVNYFTPVFFMSGASVVVFVNDIFSSSGFAKQIGTDHLDSKFKDWSASGAGGSAQAGNWWHSAWALNIPKYLSFFLAMWSIHGTFSSLRCFVQCRWRIMLLTMFIVVPRATLEVMGYVGVANWAIGRADFILAKLGPKLYDGGFRSAAQTASNLEQAITNATAEIAELINNMYGSKITNSHISATNTSTGSGNLKVLITGKGVGGGTHTTAETVASDNDVKVTITIDTGANIGSLAASGGDNTEAALLIANKIVAAAKVAKGQTAERSDARQDFEGFAYIAYHDILAMFCRFVYGKFAVGYNWTRVSLYLDNFIYYSVLMITIF